MTTSGIVSMAILLGRLAGVPADHDRSALHEVTFHGIRPSDPGGRCGLPNPERGFRIETLIGEPPGADVWGPARHLAGKVSAGYSDDWWRLDARRYHHHGLTLAQTYCYLDRFVDRPISGEKLGSLQRSLDRLRAAGLKALLRFAYEKDVSRKRGPTFETILAHIDQLAPVIQKNADVIYVLQAGFVGAWGEWHNSGQHLEKDHAKLAAVVARVLDVLPKDRMTQVRVPKYKRWVLSQPVLAPARALDTTTAFSGTAAARIGFHDDGFLAGKTDGGTWPEPPHYANPGNPEFDTMTDQSAYVPVDGELFWGDQGGKVDGLRAAVRMRLHHYSSFSLSHSYSEREGKPYSIDTWMTTPLTADDVKAAKLPLSDGYFEDGSGQPVERTQFEYIRDHLGYRIELRRARFPKTVQLGAPIPIEVELINRGFSVMHNPRPVYLVLINAQGAVAAVSESAGDPRTWQPAGPGDADLGMLIARPDNGLRDRQPDCPTELTRPHSRTASNSSPAVKHCLHAEIRPAGLAQPGSYLVGLWLPDASAQLKMDPHYAVRVANRDVPWWTSAAGQYGINVLGAIELQGKSRAFDGK